MLQDGVPADPGEGKGGCWFSSGRGAGGVQSPTEVPLPFKKNTLSIRQ